MKRAVTLLSAAILLLIADFGLRIEAQSSERPQSAIANPQSAAEAAFERGRAHAAKYEWEEAFAALEEAARLFKEAGDKRGESGALHEMGAAHHELGNHEKALAFYGQSMALDESLGDMKGALETLANIGGVHWNLADYATALSYYERSLAMAEETGDEAAMARAFGNIGVTYAALGDYARALAFSERGLAIKTSHASTDEESIAWTILNMGAAHYSLGDYAKALALSERGLAILESLGDKLGAAWTLGNIGVIHATTGDYAKALVFSERGLAMAEETGNKGNAAETLGNMGDIYWLMGDHAAARAFYEKSLAAKEELGDKAGVAETLASLGNVSFGPVEERIPYGERALALALEIDAPEKIYTAHMALGAAWAAQLRISDFGLWNKEEDSPSENPQSAIPNPHSKALRHFRSAIETAESMRSLLSESEHKSGFLGTKLEAYEGLVELLIVDLGLRIEEEDSLSVNPQSTIPNPQSEEAFSVAERMKARSFLDELGAAKFSRAGVSEELLQEKRLLEARIKWLRERQ